MRNFPALVALAMCSEEPERSAHGPPLGDFLLAPLMALPRLARLDLVGLRVVSTTALAQLVAGLPALTRVHVSLGDPAGSAGLTAGFMASLARTVRPRLVQRTLLPVTEHTAVLPTIWSEDV